jgi:hypothetical protein
MINKGTKIGFLTVFQSTPKDSSTNICGVPWNSDSYPPNTLAIVMSNQSRGLKTNEQFLDVRAQSSGKYGFLYPLNL